MIRFPDWQSRLERFLREHRDDKFRYGSWDCALFACDAIQTITGVDPAVSFRGRYASRSESLQAIREYAGTASLRALALKMTTELDMRQVPPLFAARGDVVLLRRGKRGFSLGVIGLNGKCVETVSDSGLRQVPLSLVVCGWRV